MSVSRLRRLFSPHCLPKTRTTSIFNPNPPSSTASLTLTKTKPVNSRIKAALKPLYREHDPDKLAAGFISAAASFRRVRCGPQIYKTTVRRLALAGRHDLVHSILDSQKNFPADISKEGFTARLIRLYGTAGMTSHAASLYHQLPALNCPRTTMAFNALLTAYLEAKDSEGLAAVFKEIPASDSAIVPNMYSYNILMSVLCAKPDMDEAMNVLHIMEKSGVKPNSVSFNILLKGFYSNGRFDEGDRVWTLMKEKNRSPDVISYNMKLNGLVSNGKVKEASKIVDEMVSDGVKPNTSSFNALIRGFCEVGELDEAKRMYLDMLKNDCVPNRETYEVILPRLVESGELDTAAKFCHEAFSHSCHISASLIRGVVEALAGASRRGEAEKLVEAGWKNGIPEKKLSLAVLFSP